MGKVLGRYKITYLENGFVQEKNLITGDEYESVIKPMRDLVYDLSKDGNKAAAQKVESDIKETYGDFFTTTSPMFLALITGVMILPEHQGGEHTLKIEPILV